ncbi:T-cell surface antigen CD2-like [Alosa pseudoharengus]|uniref:T-cell surface antigen CD2-like n=1 Tax=Alosa pseudoharengus TaxID=34774 RepID=UPI003F8BF5F8
MKAGNALLMLMVGVAQAMFQPEAICDITQQTTCYGTLGQTMFLQLSKNIKGMDVNLHHNSKKILILRKKPMPTFLKSGLEERCQFNPENGTLRIRPVLRDDSGLYTVKIFDENGKNRGEHTAQLTIEAPVGTPLLNHLCDDQNRTVNCSSSGDSVQYSWSLDGSTMWDARRSTDRQTLQLFGNMTGKLTCSVKNSVSSGNATVLLESCHDAQTVTVTDSSDRTVFVTTRLPSSIGDVIIEEEGGMHWIYYVIIAVSAMLLISLTVTIYLCRKRRTTQTAEQGWSADLDYRADGTENNYSE